MFFITRKDSETGNKFKEIVTLKDKAFDEQKAFAAKYKFKTWRGDYWSVWGGISSCLDFDETPDKKIWGKGADTGEFFPKKNTKIGKAINKEIEELTQVQRHHLNDCIGFEPNDFTRIGFAYDNKDYFGFITQRKWDIEIPSDCEEVNESQYCELFNIE